MKTYYLQINQGKIITDVIEYPHEGYIPYQTDKQLPTGVYGGWFKLEDGQIVEYPELKPTDALNEFEEMKTQLQAAQDDLGTVLFERAIDKAKIADLEVIQGEMLVEIAMFKMGGAL